MSERDDLFAPDDPLENVDDRGALPPPPRKPGDDPHEVLPRRPATPVSLWGRIGTFAAVLAATQALLLLIPLHGATMYFIGITQLLAVIPLAIYAVKKKDNLLLKVTLIGAGVVFLLNAACFGAGALMYSFGGV